MYATLPMMTREVIVVPPELSLDAAWAVMRRENVHHLPVVRGGELLGMLSDRDVLRRGTPGKGEELLVPSVTVGEAMTPAPVVCEANVSLGHLVRMMTERRIDAIPIVTASKRLLGLVTSTDLLFSLVGFDDTRPLPLKFELRRAEIAKA